MRSWNSWFSRQGTGDVDSEQGTVDSEQGMGEQGTSRCLEIDLISQENVDENSAASR